MKTFIYALEDPESGEIRYIGKADNLKDRLRNDAAAKQIFGERAILNFK